MRYPYRGNMQLDTMFRMCKAFCTRITCLSDTLEAGQLIRFNPQQTLSFIQNPITMNRYPLFFTLLAGFFVFWACQKDASTKTGAVNLNVRLTDGPGDYQQVNVDILEVRIKTADDTSQWLTVPTNSGIYNLLDFQNGADTLIASGPVPAVLLQEVRLILGPNNSVMQDSILYDLDTPSAEQSGLKIKIDKSLNLPSDSLTLDFDAAKSIVTTGNGKFILKPVIKIKD